MTTQQPEALRRAGEYPPMVGPLAVLPEHHKDIVRAYADATCAMRAQVAPAAVTGPSESVKFMDQSTADPVEKARRYLKAMGDQRTNSAYFFDDGYPRRESAQDALATLAILEQLAAAPTTQAAPQREVFDEDGFRAWLIRNLPDNTIIGSSEWWANHIAVWAQRFMPAAPQPAPVAQGDADDAARYRCWRDNTIANDLQFLLVVSGALPDDVGVSRRPTAAEWDAAMDAARSQAKEGGAA